jgi:F-type H+-transporting ATPase subunit b
MRTGLFATLAGLLIGVALAAGTARAQAEHDAPKSTSAAKDEHAPKAKDDTGFMGIKRYDLGIYTLVVFGLLFFILGRYAWGPILQGLQKREDIIRRARDEAEQALAEAQKLRDELAAQRASAADEVRGLMDEARRDAQALRDQMRADAAKDVQAERERLRREIDSARDQALQDIYTTAVQFAEEFAKKAIRRKLELSPDERRRLVDDALTELQQTVGKA